MCSIALAPGIRVYGTGTVGDVKQWQVRVRRTARSPRLRIAYRVQLDIAGAITGPWIFVARGVGGDPDSGLSVGWHEFELPPISAQCAPACGCSRCLGSLRSGCL